MEKQCSLVDFLNRNTDLSETDIIHICNKIVDNELEAGDFLRKSGSLLCRIGYLQEGVLGIFMQCEDGSQILRHLVGENNFFTDLVDSNAGACSAYSIQALSPCRVCSISLTEAKQLTDDFPQLLPYYHQVREQCLLNVIHNIDFLRQGNHTQQYLRLLDRHPNLFQLLPLKYIAEFLGITPQSLSRIRHSV